MRSLILVLIALCLAGILVSLGSGLFHLSRGDGAEDSRKLALALTVRVSLSLTLFALLFMAWRLGFLAPHSLAVGVPPHP